MAYTIFFPPNFTPLRFKGPNKHAIAAFPSYLSASLLQHSNKRNFPMMPSVASIPHPSVNVEYLEREFSGHGVGFEKIGDDCVVKMVLENGSMVKLMLPSGLITSYKAPLWHGSTLELLHTTVSEGEGEGEEAGAAIKGGLSLAFTCGSEGHVSWSPSTWSIHEVRGSPQESILVELKSSDSEDMVEVRYIVTVKENELRSELVVSNSRSTPLQLRGSFLSHLTVSTPDATYAIGLEGSNFYNLQPFGSKYSIVPPNPGRKIYRGSIGLKVGLPFDWSARDEKSSDNNRDEEDETEREEDDNYKHLTEQMSRIYTSAPRDFTVIDRGRRNSVIVGRTGLDELYIFSPGSRHEWYGKYAYICVCQAAMLRPIILGPDDVWRGGQRLCNPNL